MDMMMMDMSGGEDEWLAKIYWMFVGAIIGIATLVNLTEKLIYRQRLASALREDPDPAKPKNIFLRIWATIIAITREAFYAAPSLSRYPQLSLPTFGSFLLIATNISLLLSMAFHNFDLNNKRQWESIAMRCGWITLTQLPLVFLLAGKRNAVGFLTGLSYERLNWIHRWVARCLFVTATLHLAFFFKDWARFDYIRRHLEIDLISQRGLSAWCVLSWIVVSSFTPIRNLRYEIFVIQHFISYLAFITLVMLHLPVQYRRWAWAPIGIYLFDRTVRTAYIVYQNISFFHWQKRPNPSTILACKATLKPLPEGATQITIQNPPFTWAPGQHVFIACHSVAPFQSHPFTIHSLPSDGHCSFIARTHTGATRRFFRYASRCLPPLEYKSVIVDGPYGRMRPLEQFDTVVLIAGSTGSTFTMPLLRDLMRRAKSDTEPRGSALVTRRIRFVWVVKNRGQVQWFARQLTEACDTVSEIKQREKSELDVKPGLDMEASIYITCDNTFTAESLQDSSESLAGGAVNAKKISTSDEKNAKPLDTETMTTKETPAPDLCGGDVCCCTDKITEEDTISSEPSDPAKVEKTCACGAPAAQSPSTPQSSNAPSPSSPQASLGLHENINIIAGRPTIKILIKKELEKARGESAVVVCGPKGLVAAVREKVVELSDERAVHKGTGAQGIYLHTECFGW